jgi:citrate synthase
MPLPPRDLNDRASSASEIEKTLAAGDAPIRAATPLEHLTPSVYHDPREVVWKHLVAQAYWEIVNLLRQNCVALANFDAIRFPFLRAFNSNHDIDVICRKAEEATSALLASLQQQGHAATAVSVETVVSTLRLSLAQALGSLHGLRHVDRTQSHVVDQSITIAGKAAVEFAANPDYIAATLELVDEHAPETVALALAAWRRGFVLDNDVLELVRTEAQSDCRAYDLFAEVLIREQRSGRHPNLGEFEYVPGRTEAENRRAKLQAIDAGYFLLGRLTSCAAFLIRGGVPTSDAPQLDSLCPLDATMAQAAIELTPVQIEKFRAFLLIRCTHGLNPGEFTARIAASARTTFPQALIASLMVRAGRMHGGALSECMKLLDAYLAAPSRTEFVRRSLESSDISGFGHRIHKPVSDSDRTRVDGDPRVAFQLASVRDSFPNLQDRIDALVELAALVRNLKPTLSPNTDFASAIFFHCLGLNAEAGSAVFTIGRLPGMIANVINQLEVKANALRPPLAVNLPYTV